MSRHRPVDLLPSGDRAAPVVIDVADPSPRAVADQLHAQLAVAAADARERRILHRLARHAFRTVHRHVRARRAAGHRTAPVDLRRHPPTASPAGTIGAP